MTKCTLNAIIIIGEYMEIKQVWNEEIAKDFANMSFDEQAKLYRRFKVQFNALSEFSPSIADEKFCKMLEECVLLAVDGDVIAQDFLTFTYKKGRDGIFAPHVLRAYKWGIIASANGSKLSINRLKFFYQPAFYKIAEYEELDKIIDEYNLTTDNIEYFFASALADMIMSASNVNMVSLSKLDVIPEPFAEEDLRELERVRDRVIGNMINLLIAD